MCGEWRGGLAAWVNMNACHGYFRSFMTIACLSSKELEPFAKEIAERKLEGVEAAARALVDKSSAGTKK